MESTYSYEFWLVETNLLFAYHEKLERINFFVLNIIQIFLYIGEPLPISRHLTGYLPNSSSNIIMDEKNMTEKNNYFTFTDEFGETKMGVGSFLVILNIFNEKTHTHLT